ncbi:MAG: nucleotide exchange factor GrpE [Gemmatimonadetes bacterium]|nr:nucleotide exchange factor GrpE [Gemmatimonadota bacterium]
MNKGKHTAEQRSGEMNVPDNEGMQEKVREAGSEDRTGAAETEADGDAEARATEAAAAEAAAEEAAAEASHAEDEAPGAGSPAEPVDGQTPISELEAQRDRLRDQHLRLAADFDNFRKRTEDRLRQRWNRAQADLVARFLDPLDDLRRVTALEPESTASVDAIVEGVDLVERKFSRALEEAGVEVVDPEGEDFDPNTMEAMMRVPTESEDDDDTVANVFQRGYTLKGILIRPARVSVFKSD